MYPLPMGSPLSAEAEWNADLDLARRGELQPARRFERDLDRGAVGRGAAGGRLLAVDLALSITVAAGDVPERRNPDTATVCAACAPVNPIRRGTRHG